MSNIVPMEKDSQQLSVVTPMQLLQMAVQQGTSVEQLEKLMALKERWEANEARKAYFAALNEFKKNPPTISKNKDVSHNGKFMYKHATLDQASKAIGEALAKVDISHHWDTEQMDGGKIRVTCVLTHALGHSERTPLEASPDTSGSKNAIQAVGSTVTYLQRYTLLAATGMAVENQDDDGKQGKKGMDDGVLADFQSAIGELPDEPAAKVLWQKIATATTAAGDVEAHETLRAAMTAKRKTFKAPKQEATI